MEIFAIQEQLSLKQTNLLNELNDIKTLIEIPCLYIFNYFNDIRNEIDIAVTEKLIKENGRTSRCLIKNWIQMIDYVYAQEAKCLKNIKKSKLTTNLIDSIKIKLISLENMIYNKYENELENLANQLYEERFKIEKFIFLSQTLIYLDKKNSKFETYFEKMNLQISTGKIILIKNEYFSQRGIMSIKNSKYSNKDLVRRLTNENIKSDRVKEIILETNASNHIEEIWLDNRIFEINYHYVKIVDPLAFHNLTQITQIDLSDNELKEINPYLFHSLSNLTLLDLSHNKLEELSPFSFCGLINLTEIYLHGNILKEIHPDLFKDLSQLAILSLHDNQISKLDSKLFNNLVNLTSINLSFNLLKEIDSKLFNGLSNLSYIDLSMNQLTSLDSELINGLTNLHRIFTFDNRITLADISPNLIDFIQDFI